MFDSIFELAVLALRKECDYHVQPLGSVGAS
jgi:hypothetical protein